MSDVAERFWVNQRRAPSPYAELAEVREGAFEKLLIGLTAPLRRALSRDLHDARRFVEMVDAAQVWADGLSESGLLEAAATMRRELLARGFTPDLSARCFALVRAAAGQTLGLRHFPVQLMGGWVLLEGKVAEMDTGEGKTLTATLAAATVALAGQSVHVVTVNHYLAQRDAEWMGPVYRALGLSVGVTEPEQPPGDRRKAYLADVCYCTNKDIGFDYLRDGLVLGSRRSKARLLIGRLLGRQDQLAELLHRGLRYAIVDEIDSVLVDEARTPLIIGGSDPAHDQDQEDLYKAAIRIVEQLERNRDFMLDEAERSAWLTEAGIQAVASLAEELPREWRSRRAREELVRQALAACLLYEKDKHYLVKDNKVQIIDEFTGRVMADRSWERGLHQLIEVREGCELTGRRETLARITYPRLFGRYLRLAGMSGTVAEVASELETVYKVKTVRVPRNRPNLRLDLGTRLYPTAEAKWQAVTESVLEMCRIRRPVLIGTRSVADSEHLGAIFSSRQIEHNVLNARQDAEEAAIVAGAGRVGQVTIATNMAGRGTDIHLSDEAREHGGLHVVLTEFHESPRIDRQLFGRCARQGDPGSHESIVSLEDEIFLHNAAGLAKRLGALAKGQHMPLPDWSSWCLRLFAQYMAERKSAQMRRTMSESDRRRDSSLGFAGRNE